MDSQEDVVTTDVVALVDAALKQFLTGLKVLLYPKARKHLILLKYASRTIERDFIEVGRVQNSMLVM